MLYNPPAPRLGLRVFDFGLGRTTNFLNPKGEYGLADGLVELLRDRWPASVPHGNLGCTMCLRFRA